MSGGGTPISDVRQRSELFDRRLTVDAGANLFGQRESFDLH